MKNRTNSGVKMHLILIIGLALLGWVLFSLAGTFVIKWLFTLDVWTNPHALSDYANPDVVAANKVFLLFEHTGLFVFPAVAYWKLARREGFSNWQWNAVQPKQWGLFLVFAILFTPAMNWIIHLNQAFPFPEFLSDLEASLRAMEDQALEITKIFAHSDTFSTFLFNLVIMAMLPALSEELLFRGSLQPYFLRVMGNHHAAIWITALLFSVLHFQFFGFVPRMMLGAFFGYLYYYSGNLVVPMVFHLINNALALTAMTYFGMELEATGLSVGEWIMSLSFFGLFVYLFVRWIKNRVPAFKY